MDASTAVQRAEKIYNDITRELGRADVSIKNAATLFDSLVALLRQLAKLAEELKTVSERSSIEAAKLLAQLEEQRRHLLVILKLFPPDAIPENAKSERGDALANARSVKVGVWALVQRLSAIKKEREKANLDLAALRSEADKERARAAALKKLIDEAKSMLKVILGETEAESVSEMVGELRRRIEDERRGKGDLAKQLDLCRQVQKELENEFIDVRKVLHQLFEKCAEIDRASTEMGVKHEPAPAYRQDGDDHEQFDIALSWLIETANLLMDEVRTTKRREQEIEERQRNMNAKNQELDDQLKRIVAQIADLNGTIQSAEARLRDEISDLRSTTEIMEERRALYESHLRELKEYYETETDRSGKVVDLLKALTDELNASLARMKDECGAGEETHAALVEQVEKLLAELQKMRRQFDDDSQWHEKRSEQLGREAETLKSRLSAAQERMKEMEERRKGMADEFGIVKKQLDELAVAEHEIEEQVDANNEGHVRTQNDIVRQRMENSQLAEKVASGEKAMQSRDQVLKELQERLAKTEAEIERLERQNGRLRWKAESGDRPEKWCEKCDESEDLKPVAEELRQKIEAMKDEMDATLKILSREEVALEEFKSRPPSTVDSASESEKSYQKVIALWTQQQEQPKPQEAESPPSPRQQPKSPSRSSRKPKSTGSRRSTPSRSRSGGRSPKRTRRPSKDVRSQDAVPDDGKAPESPVFVAEKQEASATAEASASAVEMSDVQIRGTSEETSTETSRDDKRGPTVLVDANVHVTVLDDEGSSD